MKKPILVVMTAILVLAVATAAMATHPLIGTWKMNAAQSKLAPNDPALVKEYTIVFHVQGDQLNGNESGTQPNGSPVVYKYLTPLNGGVIKMSQPTLPEGEYFVETVIEPGNRYASHIKNGKQIELLHLTLGKDGRTMIITDKGTDAKGKRYASLMVLEKQ